MKPEDKPKCGVCSGKHPVNYKGCPEYRKTAKKPITKARTETNQLTSILTCPQRLFADAMSNRNPANRNNAPQEQPNINQNRL